MATKQKNWITRAKKPETAGVNSRVLQEFIDKCDELGKEVHSMVVIRNNKLACEVYRHPSAESTII